MSSVDVLGIIFGRTIYGTGEVEHHYRARGRGPRYNALWEWLRSVPMVDEWDDFPWSGWRFVNSSDEEVIRRVWESSFDTDDPDSFIEVRDVSFLDEPPKQPGLSEIQEEFNSFFAKVLQDAIDDEILEKLKAVAAQRL